MNVRQPPRLQELQRHFQKAVLLEDDAIRESVVDAPPLPAAERLLEDDALLAAVVDAPPLPAADRLKIYRNAYRVRFLDAIKDTHTVLFKILGDEVFESLGAAFIDANPSVHRSIRWYGRELADFLTQREPYSDQPILAEIARFEWTLSAVFDAADAEPMGRDALRAVNPDSWDQLGFVFHPSLRRLDLAWNTVAVWQAMSRDEDPPPPEAADTATPWLLWRRELTNRFRSMDQAESAALEAARAGEPFGQICAALRAWLPEEEIPLRAATLIGTWTDSGMITGSTRQNP